MAGWGRVKNRWLRSFLAIAVLAMSQPALAARIAVVPIRIELANNAAFCSLHVSNEGPDEVAVQIRGFRWTQDADGADRLDPADVRLNPSIFELGPGQKKLVRCSLPAQGSESEDTHRLLVDELPRGTPAPGTMQTLLRLSLPVFRTPVGAVPQLRWVVGPQGALQLINRGKAHAMISKILVSRAGTASTTIGGGFYLLAGASRTVGPGGGADAISKVEVVTGNGRAQVVEKLGH